MDYKKLDNLDNNSPVILPTTYSESLSYGDVLNKIEGEVGGVVDEIKTNNELLIQAVQDIASSANKSANIATVKSAEAKGYAEAAKVLADGINEFLNEVFQSVGNGKKLIADAITDKGIPTSEINSFTDMANNISNISGSTLPKEYGLITFTGVNPLSTIIMIS